MQPNTQVREISLGPLLINKAWAVTLTNRYLDRIFFDRQHMQTAFRGNVATFLQSPHLVFSECIS